MGKKYIIELEDEPFVRQSVLHGEEGLYRAVGFKSLVFDQYGLDKLTPLEDALDSAYAHGATEAEAKYHKIAEQLEKEAYEKGLEDAWECAKKINLPDYGMNIGCNERETIFGYRFTSDVMKFVPVNEAIQKIKKWEEKQKEKDELKVGDEVIIGGTRGIITRIPEGDERRVAYISESGTTFSNNAYADIEKTGRHFDEIETLLSKMRGEKDD